MAIKGLNVRVALCTEVSIILVLSFDIRFQVKKAISYIILFFPERAYISHNNSMDITNYISIATVFSLELFVLFILLHSHFSPFPTPNLLLPHLLPLILGEGQEDLLQASLTQGIALNVELFLSCLHYTKHGAPLHGAIWNVVRHPSLILLPEIEK